jgi:transcription elongation GreA/GreB family factor
VAVKLIWTVKFRVRQTPNESTIKCANLRAELNVVVSSETHEVAGVVSYSTVVTLEPLDDQIETVERTIVQDQILHKGEDIYLFCPVA